mmetsp:Transcript_3085/g.10134  ORF Transcript_3085/g.10134 Transcript_3085/m.10134 type:complete len:261 (-) Transcript_3085:18-800(-)
MLQRVGLRRPLELAEARLLEGEAVLHIVAHGGFDALDDGFRRVERRPRLEFGDGVRVFEAVDEHGLRAADRRRLDDLDGLGFQIRPGDDGVDGAERERLLGRHLAAGDHDLRRRVRADEPRQALRAARAGQDAEVHLRQTDPRAAGHDAVVARHGELEAAAERGAVDRRGRRDIRVLEGAHDLAEARLHWRLAELRDVRARGERQAVADDDEPRRRVGERALHGRHEARAHGGAERVDRRRRDVQHGDAVAQRVAHGRHA